MKHKITIFPSIYFLLSALLLLNSCGTELSSAESSVPAEEIPATENAPEPVVSDEKIPSPSAEKPEKEEEEKLELLLYYDSYNKEYMDLLVEDFRKYYPEVTVLLRDYTDMPYRDAKTQLGEDLKNGEAPDLILDYVTSGYARIPDLMHLLDAGNLLPLDELNLDLSDCNKAVLTCGEYRGTQYFLPANFSLGYLMSTDSQMTDLGIYDASRVTLAEFSEKVALYYENYPGKFAFPTQFSSSYLPYHDGVSFFDPKTGELLPEEDIRRIVEEYSKYYREGLFPGFLTRNYNSSSAEHSESSRENLLAENLLFSGAPHFLGGLDTLMLFNRTYTELTEAGELPVIFTLPTSDGKAPAPMMNWYFAVNADTENRTAVKWFLEHAIHHETQCQIGCYYGLPVNDYTLDIIYDFYTEPDTYNRRQYKSIFPVFGEFSREFVDSYFEPIRNMRKTSFTDGYITSWLMNYPWEVEMGVQPPDEIWETTWNIVTAYVNRE